MEATFRFRVLGLSCLKPSRYLFCNLVVGNLIEVEARHWVPELGVFKGV